MPGLIGTLLGSQQKVQFIQSGTGTVISIDCTVQETHGRESPPTEFPVENGDTISDHIIIKPFSLEIHGIITDTPLKLLNSAITTAAGAILPPIGIAAAGAGVALYKALSTSKSPSVAAWGQLLALQDGRKPFDVLTTLKRYPNMWIKSISVPRDNTTGQVLAFTIQLVQLLLVSPQTVNISIYSNANLGAGLGDLGKQETSNPALEKFKQGQAAANRLEGF